MDDVLPAVLSSARAVLQAAASCASVVSAAAAGGVAPVVFDAGVSACRDLVAFCDVAQRPAVKVVVQEQRSNDLFQQCTVGFQDVVRVGVCLVEEFVDHAVAVVVLFVADS